MSHRKPGTGLLVFSQGVFSTLTAEKVFWANASVIFILFFISLNIDLELTVWPLLNYLALIAFFLIDQKYVRLVKFSYSTKLIVLNFTAGACLFLLSNNAASFSSLYLGEDVIRRSDLLPFTLYYLTSFVMMCNAILQSLILLFASYIINRADNPA